MQDGKAVLPLGTLTVEETKAPNGYLLDGAYMQAGDTSEQIKDLYLTQITEDGDLAVLSGSNQFSVSDKVIRGGAGHRPCWEMEPSKAISTPCRRPQTRESLSPCLPLSLLAKYITFLNKILLFRKNNSIHK